jgi:N-acetylmuramoyl-L-alanine amidase
MIRLRLPVSSGAQDLLASLGLLLMVASFIWWQVGNQRSSSSARSAARGGAFALVVLDPGHGGQDSGAICGGVAEKDLTLDVAQRVDRLLQAQGVATLMTRTGDSYVSLADRVAISNRAHDCIFVSIHFNEGMKEISSGVETYYAEHQMPSGEPLVSWLPFLQRTALDTPNFASQSLAGFIQQSLVEQTQETDRGTKARQFFVIANVRHPAVLVEGGFLTNKSDVGKLENADYREQLATAITEGILRYRDVLKQQQGILAAAGGP